MSYESLWADDIVTTFIHLLITFIFTLIVVFAWRSTYTPDNWQVRTFYISTTIRRTRNIPNQTNQSVSANVESTQVESPTPELESEPAQSISTQTTEEVKPNSSTDGIENLVEDSGESSEDDRLDLIETMDTDQNVVRQRRLAFFENRTETLIDPSEASGSSTESSKEDIKKDTEEKIKEPIKNTENTSATMSNEGNGNNSIRIKLKYLNDDLKLVDGQLTELLGDFRRRHFTVELSENKLVRLIFNGQLLQRDNDTLRSCGFFDNCVVHCLIHQNRTEQAQDGTGGLGNRRNERDWDLGSLFLVLISILLMFAWYIRYNYPLLFSITSTVALIIITGLFVAVSVGMIFPQQNMPNYQVLTLD